MTRTRDVVWQPSQEQQKQSNLCRFMEQEQIADYPTLLKRSEEDASWFWDAFIRFADIQFAQPYDEVLDASNGLSDPKWFVGGKINLVHNFLDKWAQNPSTADRMALIWEGEGEEERRYSFLELYRQVNRFAHTLGRLGVERGDRVAIYMPMIPETVIALYGIYKAGVIAVPLFSGFGPEAVAVRLRDVEAKAVVTADGFYRGGQQVLLKHVLDKALETAPSVQAVLVAARLGEKVLLTPGRDWHWNEWMEQVPDQYATVTTDAEEVCMVSYSSGTTGSPKGIVHVHGGIAVKTAEVGMFIYDIREDDVFTMITDFGWMMGQLPLFSAHSVAAPFLMYEGSPMHPDPGRIYRQIEKHQVSVFGAPATALRLLKTYAEPFREKANLDSLRILGHTGEPIDEETWSWYLSWTDGKAPIINGSGGTEVFAEILSSISILPQKPTCLGATPAVGARVVDEWGNQVERGKAGYLVFTVPQPAQTRGFWRNRQRYLDTYFPLGNEMWWQGDIVLVDEDGYWFHHGRADDVIKVSGRRTGPGELEDVVCQFPDVLEAAAIGVPHPLKGEEIVLFVVPTPTARLDADALKQHVSAKLGKPYEPGHIHQVADLPKTRTQKIMRRLMKQHYLGEELGDTSSLMNPGALNQLPRKQEMKQG